MKKWKKGLAATLMIAMMAGIMACGDSKEVSNEVSSEGNTESEETANASDEKRSVFFVAAISGGVCWGPAQEGFEQACEDLGYESTWVSPTIDNNTTEMVTLCESALTQGADILIVSPFEDEPFHDVLEQAMEKGIPVILAGGKVSEGYYDAFLGTEPVAYGKAQAQALYDLMEDKEEEINVVYMQSLLTSVSQNQQYEACMDKLEELGVNINLSLHEECQSNSATAADRLAALKKTYPEINAIIMADGYGAEGCGSFVQDGGYADEIYAVGCDDTEPTLTYLRDGILDCSIIQQFYDMGYQSVVLGKDFYAGETLPLETDTGTYVITPADAVEHGANLGFDLSE